MAASPAREPFVLLDDARTAGASPARLYRAPRAVVVAQRPEDLAPALAQLDTLHDAGLHLAGTLAYEAGLVLEPRLAPRAAPRGGAAGPLLWFGAFDGYTEIATAAVPDWLATQGGGGPADIGPLDPALSPADYLAAFDTLQAAITAGDIYQANLTFPLVGGYSGDPLALYARLRPAAAAGYGGVVFDGTHWLLSLSPELFIALHGRQATVKPMKGTRPRHVDPAADAAAAVELAGSVKDRAENLMIVDLMRNDVSRVAEPGSVRVEAPYAIESYPTVHQMVSTVRATLQPGTGIVDLIRAIFPCGSITGAPKIRAMELIDAVERDARGPYCGAIGRIDPPRTAAGEPDGYGDSAFNVAIRTLRLTPGESNRGRAVLGVGSAIVADSNGMTEWRECLIKGGFVRASAGGFDLIETMAFDPESGIALLEHHLERARASAAELGFQFDRHAIRNAIQALCFEQDAPAQVRLTISRSGAYALEIGALPPELMAPARCAALHLPVDPGDWRLRHKTTDRGFYEAARRAAQAAGADEALLVHPDGVVTEGSFTSIFVERGGVLLTPPVERGLLPGVLRARLLAEGRAREADLTLDDLSGGFLIGNALRGLLPAALIGSPG